MTDHRDELPRTLQDLGADLDAAYRRAEARDRARSPQRRRVVVVALAALLALVPAAIGTRSIWAPDAGENDPGGPRGRSQPVILARSSGGGEQWELSGFDSAAGVCLQLAVAALRSVDCERRAGALDLRTVSSGRATYVYGVVPRTIATVVVTEAGHSPLRLTPTDPPKAALDRAGFAADFRIYVGVVHRPVAPGALRGIGLDRAGRAVLR